MIREASIYTLKKLSSEDLRSYGVRVLTMRRWPRGIAHKDLDFWLPSAGPSMELLVALHTKVLTWDQFLARYLEEQEQQESCRVVSYERDMSHSETYACRSLDYLAHLVQEREIVTLLCWEQDEHCHRFALAQRLARLIMDGSSIQQGDAPCH